MPHHLTMTDEWVAGDRTLHNVDEPAGAPGQPGDPNTKVNPPLRPVADTELLAALQDGTFRHRRHRPRPARGQREGRSGPSSTPRSA